MATVIVNDIEIEVGPKDNVIQAARRAGVEIPHYCWHDELSVVASCRMCLVEVGERKEDGSIVMGPKLMPACQTPAKPNTVIKTDTAKVKQGQQMTLEFLLLNHPLDCSICDQAGECYLQDYTYKYGKAESRLDEPKVQRLDKYHIGEQIALFTDRCVMCTRCVRFTREISGTAELQVVSRGSVEEIDVFPDKPCNNKLAGNVVDLCPVGALCSKDFLYKKRVWWLKSQDSVCAGCSTGCSIEADQNENKVYRLRPRVNPQAQGSFMCDEGRFGFKYVHDDNRLTRPWLSDKVKEMLPSFGATNGSANGKATQDLAYADPWIDVLSATRKVIAKAAEKNAAGFVALFSPMMTVEEAYLLAGYLKSVNKSIRLAMGPVLDTGSNDVYPKLPDGTAVGDEKARFIIRSEKAPNRKGVEMVLKHFEGKLLSMSDISKGSSIDTLYIVGGHPLGWATDSLFKLVEAASMVIVQDILSSPLTAKAHIVLAGGSFLERDGTYINHAGLAQSIKPAIRSPGDARSDGRLLSELSERRGLFNAKLLRQEVASKIPALAPLAVGDLGSDGVFVSK
jgi:NADH-quinone oxidoreductase subunit G